MCIFSNTGPLLLPTPHEPPCFSSLTTPRAHRLWEPFPSPPASSQPEDRTPLADTARAPAPRNQKQDLLKDNVHEKFASVMVQLLRETPKLDPAATGEDQNPLHSKTVFLVDWDDTIMPTSHLEQCRFMEQTSTHTSPAGTPPPCLDNLDESLIGLHNIQEDNRADLWVHLAQLDRLTVGVLHRALKLGRVVIVTNAGQGWVEMSSDKFLPLTARFLNHHDIPVVSARAKYNAAFPDEPCEWKVHAFHDVLYPREETNVLVFGDSVSDQYAAHRAVLGGKLAGDDRLLKFVKFAERPTADFLRRQWLVTQSNLAQLTDHDGSFDVNVAAS